MHSFKKAVTKVIIFTLVFLLICTPSLTVYFMFGSLNNDCYKELRAQEGKIDFVFCGASQAVWAFIPKAFDEKYSCNSFNISSGLLSMGGRYEILTDVIENNPVKTVVMDISYNALTRSEETDSFEGEVLLMEHLRPLDRIRYAFGHIEIDEIPQAFYYMFRTGTTVLAKKILGSSSYGPLTGKGYYDCAATADMTGTIFWFQNGNPRRLEYSFIQENIDNLEKLLDYCESKGVKVILVTTPYPTKVVSWGSYDTLLDKYIEIAQKHSCPYYDFNLLKEKESLFPDETSFYDEEHCSRSGALTVTETLCGLIKKGDGGVRKSESFYPTYHEYIDEYLATHEAP